MNVNTNQGHNKMGVSENYEPGKISIIFLKNPLLKLHDMRDTLQINEGIFAKDGLSEVANNLQPNQILYKKFRRALSETSIFTIWAMDTYQMKGILQNFFSNSQQKSTFGNQEQNLSF